MRDPYFSDETVAAFVFIFGTPWLVALTVLVVSLLAEGGAA